MASLLVGPLQTVLQLAVSAAVVAVVVVLIFVAHPRCWWLNRSFDVEGYVHDDLFERMQGYLTTVAAVAAQAHRTLPAATVTVADGVVAVLAQGPGTAAAVGSAFANVVRNLLPSAASVAPAAVAAWTADTLEKQVIDMASPASVVNANKTDNVALLVAETGMIAGQPMGAFAFAPASMLPVCLALDKPALSALRAGAPNHGLADLVSSIGSKVPSDDPGAALLHACIAAPTDAAAWTVLRQELDPVIAGMAAVAELRHAYSVVFPQVRLMRIHRVPEKRLMKVFAMFNDPYVQEFMTEYSGAVRDYDATKNAAWAEAKAAVRALTLRVKENVSGSKPDPSLQLDKPLPPQSDPSMESFRQDRYVRSTFFGVHVDESGREVFVEEMSIGSFFSSVASVLKMLPKILVGVGGMMEGIVEIFKAFLAVFKQLKHGPFEFIVSLLLLIVNSIILVIVLVLAPVWTVVIWFCLALVPLIIQLALYAVILCVSSVLNLVMAFADIASGGALQHLALSEDHPEAWFVTPGAHSGNGTGRFFGTLYPCGAGYVPGILPTYCGKVSRCVPLRSPAAMLMNSVRNGALVATGPSRLFAHPLVPDDSVACTRQTKLYEIACNGQLRTNGFTVSRDAVSDLVLVACAGRMQNASSGVTCELCASAAPVGMRALASASSSPAFVPKPAGTSGSVRATVTVLLVIAGLIAARVVAQTASQ